MTITEPKLEYREAQSYVAVRSRVRMDEIAGRLPPLLGEVFAWLAKKGTRPSDAPFWRYLVIDMEATLEIDVAVPVATPVLGDGRVIADVLPKGRYATALFVGPPAGLLNATMELLAWAERSHVVWKVEGNRWAGRIERYLTDPAKEPDQSKWRTELAFLTDG